MAEDASAPGQVFFGRLSDWAWYKHRILDKYLRIWVYHLAKTRGLLAFVDGCAGEGSYADGQPGSPLLAAKWNEEQVLKGYSGRLVVHACETDPGSVQRLRKALEPWTSQDPPLAHVYAEPFEQVLPDLLERTRSFPTLFFLDPYNLGPLRSDRLRPLLEDRDRAPTEILMRIDPVLLARYAGWVKRRDRPARAEKAAERFRTLLELYNIDATVVEARFAEGSDPVPMEYLDAYLELFQHRFRYVQYVPIRSDYFAAPKYLLVHCSDSPYGAAFFNDAASTTEDDLFEDTLYEQAGGQGFLFPLERPPRVRVLDAERAILEILENGPLEWIEVRAQLALRLGSDLREKHHKKAATRLRDDGRITFSEEKLEDRTVIGLRT